MRLAVASLFFFFLLSFDSTMFEKRKIELGEKKIKVEIADTPLKRTYGLMHRETLGKNEGMLFVFPESEYITMWMKETKIPLDVGYFDEDRTLFQIEEMPVERGAPYRLYRSNAPAKYALEMNRGWFRKNNIKPGIRFKYSN